MNYIKMNLSIFLSALLLKISFFRDVPVNIGELIVLVPIYVICALYILVGFIRSITYPTIFSHIVASESPITKKYIQLWLSAILVGVIIAPLGESPKLVPYTFNFPRSAVNFLFWIIAWSGFELFRHLLNYSAVRIINSRFR